MSSQQTKNSQDKTKTDYILALSNNEQFNIDPSDSEYFVLYSPSGELNSKRQYIFQKSTEKILEIQLCKEENPKSIFLGNYVQTGQNFLMISQVDPLFLIIPYLDNARGKVKEANTGKKQEYSELFKSRGEEYKDQNEIQNIQKYLENNSNVKNNIQKICSYVKYGDDEYYRMENNKLYEWLDQKLQKAQQFFQQNIEAFITNSIQVKLNDNNKDDAFYLAMTLIYQYLPQNLFLQYIEKHDLSEKQFMDFKNQQNKKRATNNIIETQQMEDLKISNDQKPKKVAKKQTASELKNQEAAKGTKSIMSFFQKKK